MSPTPCNDDAPELTAAQALALASRLRDRIAIMETGLREIADGSVGPEQAGHYLAHRKCVRIARNIIRDRRHDR